MIIPVANRIQQVSEYYFSTKLREIEQMRLAGKKVLNLGIGSPDFSPPKKVLDTLNEWSKKENAHGYQSYKGIPELRFAIADWSNRIYDIHLNPDDEILPLIGSKEGIMHISQAFVNKGDNVLVPNPGYPTYRSVSLLLQAEIRSYNIEEEGTIDIAAMENLIDENTKIIWINFPNMPTGYHANHNNLKELIKLAKEKRCLIVNDNPYSTILNNDFFSIFQLEGAQEVCIELNSLSKSHNMPGWRIGWLSGHSDYISAVLKVKSNMDSGMFLPLQKAAVEALNTDQEWTNSLNQSYRKRKELAVKILNELNCTFNKDLGGLFIWAKTPDNIHSKDFIEDLLENHHIFIAPGFIFGSNGDAYIRISLCNPETILEESLNRIKTN